MEVTYSFLLFTKERRVSRRLALWAQLVGRQRLRADFQPGAHLTAQALYSWSSHGAVLFHDFLSMHFCFIARDLRLVTAYFLHLNHDNDAPLFVSLIPSVWDGTFSAFPSTVLQSLGLTLGGSRESYAKRCFISCNLYDLLTSIACWSAPCY